MESSTLLFTLISVVIIYIFFNNQHKRSKIPDGCISIPGPKPLPIIGNLHQLKNNGSFQDRIDDWTKEYGPIFQIRFGAEKVVVLNDYEIIRDLLVKRGAIYSSRPFSGAIIRIYFHEGKSIAASPYGKYWRAMRSVAHQALTQKMIDENYRDTIHAEIKDLTIKIFNYSSKGFEPINDIRASIAGLLVILAYGQKPKNYAKQMERIHSDFAEIMHPKYSRIDMFPWLGYVSFLEKKFNSFAYEARARVEEMNTQLFKDLHQRLRENNVNENSFAANLLRTMNISSNIVTKPFEDSLGHDDNLEEEFVFDEVDFVTLNNAFLIGGTGTTVAALNWILAILVNYPEAQRKIQKELDDCLEGNRFPTPQDDSKLSYLHATIKECYRYRPARTFLFKHATTKDDVYRGYYIPAQTAVLVSYKSAHTSEKLYERPNEFYPEHYLDENGQLRKYDELRDPWMFGKGRRACVGQNLAHRNLVSIVGYILTLFNIENDIDPITGNPIKLDLGKVEVVDIQDSPPKPYKLRFVPRPGVTLEKIMQMN